MATVRDLRREHFAELPEPWKAEPKIKSTIHGDKYMDVLEKYIDQLSSHIRKIQDEELMVTNQFSAALASLHSKSHEKRRLREDMARNVYQKKIAKIREKRKAYREMLYDAQAERKKLIDSMQIQKDEDDILRRKLAKLSALSAAETTREQRKTAMFDFFGICFSIAQILFFIAFGLIFDYTNDIAYGAVAPIEPTYQFYRDIMMMAVIGFGFLMTFLRKYQYSAIGFTLLLVALVFQWSLLVLNFFDQSNDRQYHNVNISQEMLVVAVYGVITVLISFGSVLGVVSPLQLLAVAFVEVILYYLCIFITRKFQIYNETQFSAWGFGGDATAVHVFGAYFGLALAIPLGLRVKRKGKGKDDDSDSYASDMFAMIGTVFLWVLWPSFNAALAPIGTQHRVVINTVLALCASVVFAFLSSRVFRGGKFDMIDIQNATLAGGVGIGNAAALVVGPGSALIIGAVCAVISSLGYAYLSPWLGKFGVVDTRGVHNMHGLPGLIGTFSAICAVAIAYNDNGNHYVYGQSLDAFFPQSTQTSVWMLLNLVITLAIALAGGIMLGGVLYFTTPPAKRLYSDELTWRVPSDFELIQEEGDMM